MEQLELNLKKISTLAKANWSDNWNFRAYLQQQVDPVDIDKQVHLLNTAVSKSIDCTKCANCCKVNNPILEESDVTRLAQGLNIPNHQLKESLVQDHDGTYVFCQKPCPYLQENRCSVYTSRPDDCREFPHLHKEDFLSRSINAIENYECCPIVYNVIEQLKSKFSYDSTIDFIGDTDPEVTHGSTFKGNQR